MRIAVVGVGLIGGSIALAARQRLGAEVVAYDGDASALADAAQREAIDFAAGSVHEALAGAQAAFVAVPVGALSSVVPRVLDCAPADCVVSDVGSTKRAIVAANEDQRFIGGHPLAGAETSGVAHARADLFDGAVWYLTPSARTSGVRFEALHRILSAFGARPAAIDPETHDTLMALVSHLPHVLANVLVAQAAQALEAGGERLPATGPSFRDATRVAGASSKIWTDIYLDNRDALVDQIDELVARLHAVSELLQAGDRGRVADWNDAAGAARRALLEAQLAGGALHELRVGVPNRPGVIAELALALGRAGLNITDMALHPAPDMSEGVVTLWIAGESDADRAQRIVEDQGFPVFRP
jgi:prephenate dehydrogenase